MLPKRALVVVLCFTACACAVSVTALAQQTRDMAQYMPKETALYVQWAEYKPPDSPEMKMARGMLEAITELVTSQGEMSAAEADFFRSFKELASEMHGGSGGLGLFDVIMAPDGPDIQLAAVGDAGEVTAKLAGVLRQALEMALDPGEIQEREIDGVSMHYAELTEPPLEIVWGMHKGCLVAALGETAAAKVIACMNGQAPTLTDAEEFKLQRGKLDAKLTRNCLGIYVDVQRVVTRAKEVVAELGVELPPNTEPLLDELGISGLRSKYFYYAYHDDEGVRTAAFAHVEGELRGLLSLWKQAPLIEEDLRIIPQNAYWAEVGNMDLAALWEETLRVIEAVSPDTLPMVQGSMAMTAGMLGFSITDELLPALGDTWALFDAPSHGGLLATGTVLVAEVRDQETLQGALARVMQMATALAAQGEVTLAQGQAEHNGHTIHYMVMAGQMVPVALSWGFVEDRWVLGLFPQTVAAAMKQVDSRTRGPSLLDHPEVKAAREKLPRQPIAMGYMDSKYLARMFYPLLNGIQLAGVSMFAGHGVEVDLAAMPPVDEVVTGVRNYVGATAVVEDGILYASVGGGGELVAGISAAALGTSILLPSLSRAREMAKRAVSAANLTRIGVSCVRYADGHDNRFPGSLEQLVADGVLTEEWLRSPRDPESGVGYVYLAGQRPGVDDPGNILAYEKVIGSEGTNVLFIDGRVEWMELADFERALRETYKRLGREEEIPPQYRE